MTQPIETPTTDDDPRLALFDARLALIARGRGALQKEAALRKETAATFKEIDGELDRNAAQLAKFGYAFSTRAAAAPGTEAT